MSKRSQRIIGSLREQYRIRTRNVKLSLGYGILISVLLLCSAFIAACGGTTQSSQKQDPSSQQVTTIPTQQKVTPTPKPIGIPESTAILGGSIVAFDNKIGANNCCHDNGWDTNTMWVGVYTAEDGSRWYQAVGGHSNERVVGIRIHAYNTDIDQTSTPVWDIPTAKKICNAYMPPDAKFQKTYRHIFVDLADGVINEYYSPLLAHTLPSKDFTDSNNHLEKPGLFFVYFNYASPTNASQFDFCTLGTDANLSIEDVIS